MLNQHWSDITDPIFHANKPYVGPPLVQHCITNTVMFYFKPSILNNGPTLVQRRIPNTDELVLMLTYPQMGQRRANVNDPTPTLYQQPNQKPTLGRCSLAIWVVITPRMVVLTPPFSA